MFDEKFWLALAFLAFIALLIKFAKSKIVNSLDQKAQEITEAITGAKKAKEDAEKLLEEVKNYQKDSTKYAEKLITDASKQATELAKQAKQEVENEITKKTEATILRIKSEEEIAIRELKQNIVKVAISNLEENLSKNLSNQEQKNLFTKSSEELAKNL
jgi:F-type H+-transporting ATPase subunit b